MPISNVDVSASVSALVPRFARSQAQEENTPRENAVPEVDRDDTPALQPSTVTQISDAARLRAVQEQQINVTPETSAIPPVQAPVASAAVTPAESPVREPRVADVAAAQTANRVEPAPSEEPQRAEAPPPAVPVAVNASVPPASGNAQAEVEAVREERATPAVPAAAQAAPPVDRQRAAAPQAEQAQDSAPPAAEFEPISPLLRQAANDFVASFNSSRGQQVPGFELVSVGRGEASILNARVSSDVGGPRSTPVVAQPATPPTDVDPARVRSDDSTFAVGVARVNQAQESRLQPQVDEAVARNTSDTQSLLRRQVAPQSASAPLQREDVAGNQSAAPVATPRVSAANSAAGNASPTAVEQPNTVNLAQHLNDLANRLTP